MKLTFFTFSYFITIASLSAASLSASNPLADQSFNQSARYIARINSSLCGSTTSYENPYKEDIIRNQSPFFKADTIEEFVLRGDFLYEKGYVQQAFSDWDYASKKSSFDGLLRVALLQFHGNSILNIPRNPGHGYELISNLASKNHFPSLYQRAQIDFEGYFGIPVNRRHALSTMQFLSTQGYKSATNFLNTINNY